MIPAGAFPGDSVQHAAEGIEIKASRYAKGWQGHNAEGIWLMVFIFSSNRPVDISKKIPAKPFRFRGVFGAQLDKSDWSEAARKAGSRRTATASIRASGFEKMTD